jgi:transcriptional regulator with XRE-family HTH domain
MSELQLRTWRERRALSQRDLGELAGLTAFTISRLETGQQRARPSTVRKLAKALGLKPEQLYRHPDDNDYDDDDCNYCDGLQVDHLPVADPIMSPSPVFNLSSPYLILCQLNDDSKSLVTSSLLGGL